MPFEKRFGVDEAGKGPVFGPMVVSGVSCNVSKLPEGIDDSKNLSPSTRRALYNKIQKVKNINIHTVYVMPEKIDSSNKNLNELTVKAFSEVINEIASEDESGIVDAADSDEERFKNNILSNLDKNVLINSKHKADESNPIVGAASIIAKVERDKYMANLAEEYGDVGSGYPSDPTTQKYLEQYVLENNALPPFARKSWSTCEKVLRKTA